MKLLIMNKINTKFLSIIEGLAGVFVLCKHHFHNPFAMQGKNIKTLSIPVILDSDTRLINN